MRLFCAAGPTAIAGAVIGLDGERWETLHAVWYVDGSVVKEENVPARWGSTTYDAMLEVRTTGSRLRTVRVTLDGDETHLNASTTVSAGSGNFALWDWSASNGLATAAQTAAAYQALVNRSLTANMNHLVWDDIAIRLYGLLLRHALPWFETYTKFSGAVLDRYQDLTDFCFNSVVENIRSGVWTWRDKPGATGYLGRLAVRGQRAAGAMSDQVYGSYILELVKTLNVMTRGLQDGPDVVHMAADSQALSLSWDAPAVALPSAPVYGTLGILLTPEAAARACPAAHLVTDLPLKVSGNVDLTAHQIAYLDINATTKLIGIAGAMSIPGRFLAADAGLSVTADAAAIAGPAAVLSAAEIAAFSGTADLMAAILAYISAAEQFTLTASGEMTRLRPARAGGRNETRLQYTARAQCSQLVDTDAAEQLTLEAAAAIDAQVHADIFGTGDVGVSGDAAAAIAEPLHLPETHAVILQFPAAAVPDMRPALPLPLANGGAVLGFSATLEAEAPPTPTTWEYPIEEADGLLVRQVHLVFENARTHHIQIDWKREAEAAAQGTASISGSAKLFVSRGWEFPEQKKKLLYVYQSLHSTQQDDEVEVT